MIMKIQEIKTSFNKLNTWLEQNSWLGYDPYDIKAVPRVIFLIRKSNNLRLLVLVRELVFEFFYNFPTFSRKIFNIKPEMNAKAMGLFATSYLDLYKYSDDNANIEKANRCLDWLLNNKAPASTGYGWGYPFDWQSSEFIPKNTPNGIVTTAVGDAFWNFYKFSNDQKYLNSIVEIARFLYSLPIDKINNNQICFSYTPLFINHVHNLNLFVAEFLIKTGVEIEEKEWIETGNKAVNYTISNQLQNGAFDYNGPPEKPANYIDHYHTGFILRMLHSIWKLTNREDVFFALEKGFRFYMNSMFENETIPKLKPDKKYRIDIHSCAESINCLTTLSDTFPEAKSRAEKVLDWTIKNLQDDTGYFYYGILKNRLFGYHFKSKIPYIRWGQAWMMKALSNYLLKTDRQEY